MNLWTRTLPIAVMTLALIPVGVAGAEPMVDRGNLEAVAKAAKTPADHAKVASNTGCGLRSGRPRLRSTRLM
jgi:hypothetical protein